MKLIVTSARAALCFAVVAAPAFGEGTAATKVVKPSPVKEVALSQGGLITGKVLNTSAKPIADAPVLVQYGPHVVARTRTNADGSFAIRGLRGGLHTIVVGSRTQQCRLWTSKTAPPSAVRVLAVNGDSGVLRAQFAPPVGVETVVTAITAGVIGGVIGYNVRDTKRRPVASP